MPGEKEPTATATSTQTRDTLRITRLEPNEGKKLTSLEEAVVRMHHGVSLHADAPLPTNGVSQELMAQLLDMELRAFEETGRIEELDDLPAGARASSNEHTRRIIDELNKRP